MAKLFLISLSLCFLVFSHGHYVAQAHRNQGQSQEECQFQKINAVRPARRIESEAGVTEYWDENNEQFECAGVAATRHTIQPRGLFLPHFTNSPQLTYIVQGRGLQGAVIPGCPETYQSSQQQSQQQQPRRGGQSESESQQRDRRQDRHQKIKDLRQGDIVGTPSGVAHWFYNDGERPLVMVTILHTGNSENQLDQSRREFYLAGNPQQQQQQQHGGSQEEQEGQQGRESQQEQEGQQGKESQQEQEGQQQGRESQQEQQNNIFQSIDDGILAKALGVGRETVRKMKSQNDRRGNIVRVEDQLQFVRPPRTEREEYEQQGQQGRQEQGQKGRGQEGQEGQQGNGIEETFCTMRYRENIGEPIRADVYNPQGGRIRSVNRDTLPILQHLQLSAERGVLYRNALVAPYWNMNANSVIYATGGSARVQIVGNSQRPVFDGQVREGEILIVPQNFVVVKQAGSNGFEYIAFKTNENAMSSPVAGQTSVLAAMPVDVLVNAYQGLSREEAMNLKNNRRHETMILAPSSRSQQGGRDSESS